MGCAPGTAWAGSGRPKRHTLRATHTLLPCSCTPHQVDERNKVARIGGQEIRGGDFISLNGTSGEGEGLVVGAATRRLLHGWGAAAPNAVRVRGLLACLGTPGGNDCPL